MRAPKVVKEAVGDVAGGILGALRRSQHPEGSWQHTLGLDSEFTSQDLASAVTKNAAVADTFTPEQWSGMIEYIDQLPTSEKNYWHGALNDIWGVDPVKMKSLAQATSGPNFKALPAPAQKKIIDEYELEGFEEVEDVAEYYKAELDQSLAKMQGVFGVDTWDEMKAAAEADPASLLKLSDSDWKAFDQFAADLLPKDDYSAFKKVLEVSKPAPRVVQPAVEPVVRTPEEQRYFDEMSSQFEASGVAEVINNKTGERGFDVTPSGLAGTVNDAAAAGVQPLTNTVRNRTLEVAKRLNEGDTSLVDSDLVDIDWQLLRNTVDLPMDDASRMARAREQGYTLGLDEDIWRGVPESGNLRASPGLPEQTRIALSFDQDRPLYQFGSSDYEIARGYTRFPYSSDAYDRGMYPSDYSNQDFYEGLPHMYVRDGTVTAPINSAGNAVYRMAGKGTPFEYRGEGESWSTLSPQQKLYYEGRLATEHPIIGSNMPEAASTDTVLNRVGHGTRLAGQPDNGVVFRNIVDPGGNTRSRDVSDVYALPLANVRNRDQAMFHPLLDGRRALLGGVAGAALSPYVYGTTVEDYE